MKHVLLTLFAIGIAGLAAIAATTAMLNTPVRPQRSTDVILQNIGPATSEKPAAQGGAAPSGETPATPPAGEKPAAPAEGGNAGKAEPAGAKSATADEEGDKDPYEGIAPEELPPDLQYDADASVSFPTNI